MKYIKSVAKCYQSISNMQIKININFTDVSSMIEGEVWLIND